MNKDSDADFGNMSRTSAHDFWLLVGLTLVLAVPAGIILFDIRSPRPVVPVESNASPLGYTWSLLLFIVPDMYLGWKVWRLQRSESEKKAFGHALMWLCFVAFFMDMAFGMTFLTFPYPKATLQIFLPGYDPASLPGHKWQWCIPISGRTKNGCGGKPCRRPRNP